MKKFLLFSILSILSAYSAEAQTSDGMSEGDFLAQADSDARLQQNMVERLELLDVNMDKAISANEMEEMVKGTEMVDRLTQTEKEETKAKINEYFKQADANKDNMLRDDEIKQFGKLMQVFMLKQQFRKMDRNGDGVYSFEDVPSMEESLQKLEDAVKKMKETVERVNAMDENELADSFLHGISSSMAKEDYYQMDKNHDNCVTRDEYADYYMSVQDREDEENIPEKEKLNMPREAYLSNYTRVKKANPKCLTLDEYVTDMNNIFNDLGQDDVEVAKWAYAEMDTNGDGKVTEQEYIEYEKSTAIDSTIKEEDLSHLFKSIKGSEKGWLTQEEYTTFFANIGTDAEDELEEN